MLKRHLTALHIGLASLVVFCMAGLASATPPVLQSAVSRMTHGSVGTFDVQLPLTLPSGIECRSVAGGLNIYMSFDAGQVITQATPAVTPATVTVAQTSFSNNVVYLHLTNVTDAQTIQIQLYGVYNANNEAASGTPSVTVRTLLGDVNSSGVVTGSDLNLTRNWVAMGMPVSLATFRCDTDLSGVLTSSDLNRQRAQVAIGAAVAGGATETSANLPTITAIANQNAVFGQTSTPAGFTVGSNAVPTTAIGVIATTSDPVNLPNSMISVSGNAASRQISMSPPAVPAGSNTVATPTVTLTVSDGILLSTTSFNVRITPPPTTYLASLTPPSGVSSLASGSATLVLSGDQLSATVSFSYSNLSSAVSDVGVYAPASNEDEMFDLAAKPAGSYNWTFVGTQTNPLSFIQSTITNNQAYFVIKTASNATGELEGTFNLVQGSATFTAPGPAPAITINPPSAADASRLLQQAAFGGQTIEISNLSNTGASNASTAIESWLQGQFASQLPISPNYAITATVNPSSTTQGVNGSTTYTYSPSSMYANLYRRLSENQGSGSGDQYNDDRIHECWWKNAVSGPDQLRQRVATALSEIFVVSEIDGNIDNNLHGLATYYDMLADDAFGLFYDPNTSHPCLLRDVTLHPIMGEYLNMMGNRANPNPNENYAREIMQLFTIGLYQLNPDGTLQTDSNGQPIPTYGQTDITQMAYVLTGWNSNQTPVNVPVLAPADATHPSPYTYYISSYWQLPMIVYPTNGSYHSGVQKTLMNYPGVNGALGTNYGSAPPQYGSATAGVIPAATATAASTVAETEYALSYLFNHPNTGPFFCKKLIQRLVESNPSPAYVYRVAQVFNNDLNLPDPNHIWNFSGQRGNMKAVLVAILTDYEARSSTLWNNQSYGHEREPMVRLASMLRSLSGASYTNKFYVGKTDTTASQTILRSPTVFNFFDPAFAQPGAIQNGGLTSPEFEIINEQTVVNMANMIYRGVYSNYNSSTGYPLGLASGTHSSGGSGFYGDGGGNDVYIDFSTNGSQLLSIDQTGGDSALVDQITLLLQGPQYDAGQSSTMKQQVLSYLSSLSTPIAKVQAAVYLIATSAQSSVQK